MLNWGMLIAVLTGTAVLAWVLIGFNTGHRWLDHPNSRSAHKHPMPSAGGIAMLIPLLGALLYCWLADLLTAQEALVFAGCLCVALVGLLDDLLTLSIRWRLPIQFAAATWVIYWVGSLPAVQFGVWSLEFPTLVHILGALAFVWLLNLFNFMDGIDGLAASEAGFVTLLSCLFAIKAADPAVGIMASVTCAATLGFLVWNWAPAKIFMGDVGSSLLGYLLGALALVSLSHGSMNPWSWLLLLGVFVVDATYTLVYRLCSGQRWYEAHSSHGYQIAARLLSSHQRVTLVVLVINLAWLAPLAWLANHSPEVGVYLTVLGLLPVVCLARWLGAGTAGRHLAEAG
jgi:Fuc2NAc and GlcNAc transferase